MNTEGLAIEAERAKQQQNRIAGLNLEIEKLLQIHDINVRDAQFGDDNFFGIVGDEFKRLARDFYKNMKSPVQQVVSTIMGAFDAGVDTLIRGMADGTKSLKDVLKETLESIKASILESFIQSMIQDVKKNFFDLLQVVLPGSGLFDSIQSTEEKLIAATATNTSATNDLTLAMGGMPSTSAIPSLSSLGGIVGGTSLGGSTGVAGIFDNLLGGFFDSGPATTSIGGDFGLDTLSAVLPGGGSSGGGFFDGIGDFIGGFFADGGIVNQPTLAMAGEGPTNEAFVPLPDNRSIPVELNGGEAQESTIVIEQKFDFRGSEVGAEQR